MEKERIIQELERIVESFEQLPYLFAGTGISMRYSSAPSWEKLLFDVWRIVNPSKDKIYFEKLKQKVEDEIRSKNYEFDSDDNKYLVNPRLASIIERQFNDYFYGEKDLMNSIFSEEEMLEIINNRYNPFKFYISKLTKILNLEKDKQECKELVYLIENQNKFAGIITTNYDKLIESIFKDFSVLVGQDSLLVANSLNIFEIYKIHGSCTDPNSIILTEADYKAFGDKLVYLSAKLLTIFVEHPIIFIGYGLGDVNIRNILRIISECLTSQQLEKIQNNFIFVSPAFGEEDNFVKRHYSWNEGKNTIVLNEFILNDYSVLYEGLSKIKSSMPIKLARKLQDMVCNFVYSADAQNNILFGDIDSPDIDSDKVAVYFGKEDMITQFGFRNFTIDEILEDVVCNNRPYLANIQIIESTFKQIRSSAGSTLLPIYKYVHALNYPLKSVPEEYNYIRNYDDKRISLNASEKN